jgi:hypothetical protein
LTLPKYLATELANLQFQRALLLARGEGSLQKEAQQTVAIRLDFVFVEELLVIGPGW